MTNIVELLRAPYGRLTRAMREDAACEIEALKKFINAYGKENKRLVFALEAERERCAKIVEEHWHDWPLEETVAAIREPADD